jgi:hypothetical protein
MFNLTQTTIYAPLLLGSVKERMSMSKVTVDMVVKPKRFYSLIAKFFCVLIMLKLMSAEKASKWLAKHCFEYGVGDKEKRNV